MLAADVFSPRRERADDGHRTLPVIRRVPVPLRAEPQVDHLANDGRVRGVSARGLFAESVVSLRGVPARPRGAHETDDELAEALGFGNDADELIRTVRIFVPWRD
jgi:hypothetical protein